MLNWVSSLYILDINPFSDIWPYEPAIPVLGIYLKNNKTLIQKGMCTNVFTTALFTITKTWRQPKRLVMNGWMDKEDVRYIHTHTHIFTMEYYSPIKRDAILWQRGWTPNSIILSEISPTEKVKYHMVSHIWGLNKLTNHIDKRAVVTREEEGWREGRMGNRGQLCGDGWEQLFLMSVLWCKELTCQCRKYEMWVWSLRWEDHLEEGMTTHSSILAWRIMWTEGPGGYSSQGC